MVSSADKQRPLGSRTETPLQSNPPERRPSRSDRLTSTDIESPSAAGRIIGVVEPAREFMVLTKVASRGAQTRINTTETRIWRRTPSRTGKQVLQICSSRSTSSRGVRRAPASTVVGTLERIDRVSSRTSTTGESRTPFTADAEPIVRCSSTAPFEAILCSLFPVVAFRTIASNEHELRHRIVNRRRNELVVAPAWAGQPPPTSRQVFP